MLLCDHTLLRDYSQNDIILQYLKTNAQPIDDSFVSHQWLMDSLPKRMIYHLIYGDFLTVTTKPLRILDVGGGYCALSRKIIQNHDYTLLDIMAHDDHDNLKSIENSFGKTFWGKSDWYETEIKKRFDIIIANDLFPNVDQRLALFIEKYLPLCQEMRLSLTYYNIPRFYTVKRVDADEIFNMMAWDGTQVKKVLESFSTFIKEPQLDILLQNPPSLFANNRQICLVTLIK